MIIFCSCDEVSGRLLPLPPSLHTVDSFIYSFIYPSQTKVFQSLGSTNDMMQ